jgi:hypothetical protein
MTLVLQGLLLPHQVLRHSIKGVPSAARYSFIMFGKMFHLSFLGALKPALLAVLRPAGKLAAVHNGGGRLLWAVDFGPRPGGGYAGATAQLLPWRSSHDVQHAPEARQDVLLALTTATRRLHVRCQPRLEAIGHRG